MPSPRGLVQWLDQGLHRSGLLPREGRLLVAVSGGADSVALLRLMAAVGASDYWRWELVVGHVDHGMRGLESMADAVFVRALAKKLKLRYMVKRLMLGPKASEAAAREGRLRALKLMMQRRKCVGVVMAHHAEDQAETILMRLFRGCGLEGLMGMGERSVVEGMTIFRPLLEVRPGVLREYLREVGQLWREDKTNGMPRYTRNRVRAEVLPVVEGIWPRAVEAIGRMSRIAEEAREPVAYAARSVWEAAAVIGKRRVSFSRGALRTWPAVMAEVLRRAVEHVGGTRELADWERIQEAVRVIRGNEGGKVVEMGVGVVVRVGKEVVVERGVTGGRIRIKIKMKSRSRIKSKRDMGGGR